MNNAESEIEAFFDAYAKRFNQSLHGDKVDIEGTVNSFAGCFVEASPVGINCGKNDEKFKEMIPKGYAFYKSIGTQFMDIISKQVTILDDFHAMVKVHWQAGYKKNNPADTIIEFDVIYMLQLINGIKIFAYITGDEQKVLKEKGLV